LRQLITHSLIATTATGDTVEASVRPAHLLAAHCDRTGDLLLAKQIGLWTAPLVKCLEIRSF
jgi:hypothetical protein